MTEGNRNPYEDWKERQSHAFDELANRIVGLRERLGLEQDGERSDSPPQDSQLSLTKMYCRAEAEFLAEYYGLDAPLLGYCGFDRNWDRFIRSEAASSEDDELLNFHIRICQEREETAQSYWELFVGTGHTDALDDYIRYGGDINPLVRKAIVESRENKSYEADFRRFEDYRKVREIMQKIDPKTGVVFSLKGACTELAVRRNGKIAGLDSIVKTIGNHVLAFEKLLTQKLPRR